MVEFKILNICKGVILFVSLLIPYKGSAQDTGPGGVGTSANIAFWLDATQLGLNDGDVVSTWQDISGNGNDFSQNMIANKPTFVSSSPINSVPSVYYDGGDFMDSGVIPALDSDDFSCFVVFKIDNAGGFAGFVSLIETESSFSSLTWAIFVSKQSGTISQINRRGRNSGGTHILSTSNFPTSELTDAKIVDVNNSSSNDLYGSVDGGNRRLSSGANATFTHINTRIGARNIGSNFLKGYLSELVVFPTTLNTAQSKIIYNYLSAKYGIELDSLEIYAYNSTHYYDVAGIGREDASNQHLSAQGTGPVSMTIASLDDGEFLVWGHDDAGFSTSTLNTPISYTASNGTRISQEWVVTETGDLSDNGDISFTFDISGNEFGGSNDDYTLIVDTDGDDDWSNADTITTSYAAGVISCTVPAGTLDDGSKFTLGNTNSTIISIVDGQDWNQDSTWSCNCIPAEDDNVTVDLGHTVTVSDTQAVNNLTITGTLSFDNGANFDIKGDVASTGSLTMNSSSTITLSGSSLQTLDFAGTAAFDNLELDNANGALLNTGAFSFASSLLVTDGDLDFNNNTVTFLSSASGTAAIGPISGSISGLTNNVISQRFIEGGVAGWSEVGFPFMADCDLTEWDDEMFMSGPTNFDDGCAYGGNGCFNSATYWDASSGVNVGIDDAEMPISQGVGIDLFMGDDLNTWTANTLVVDSRIINLTLSEEITTSAGWNFIANPFLCPVDFDLATRSNVDNYYWVYGAEEGWLFYDPDGFTITNSSSANMANGVISSYQGFWVFSSGAGSITFDQSTKSMTSPDEFLKSGMYSGGNDYFTAVLQKEGAINPPSRVYINLSTQKSPNDFNKLPTRQNDYNLYVVDKDGEEKSLLSTGQIEECRRIPLGIEGISNGDYTFSFENVPGKGFYYLIDNFTGEVHELNSNESFAFNLSADDHDRFTILITKNGVDCEQYTQDELNLNYYVSSNGVIVSGFDLDEEMSMRFEVVDLSGKLIHSETGVVNYGTDYYLNKSLSSGVYIIQVKTMEGGVVDAGKLLIE